MFKIILWSLIIVSFFPLDATALSAESAVLIDGNSGRILFEHNADKEMPMASTTKIMTGLLACESEKLKESVKVSPFASGTEGSSLWLKIGEKQILEDLIYGLMLKSGNDAAVAIAEHLGGNVDAFTLLMNKKAREIGAINTNFENPHGLDSDGHYTTAYDLALIAREAMKNEEFREIVSTKTYSIPMKGEKWDRTLKNHNKLLWNYDGCNGVKTGFTKKSGRCLVSSAEKNGQSLICVTLNASDDWNDHKYLLDYGFDNFISELIVSKDEFAERYTYNKKYNKNVDLVYANDFKVAKNSNDIITINLNCKKIKLPAKKGTVAGYAEIICNGEKIGTVELLTNKKINKVSFFEKLKYKYHKLWN